MMKVLVVAAPISISENNNVISVGVARVLKDIYCRDEKPADIFYFSSGKIGEPNKSRFLTNLSCDKVDLLKSVNTNIVKAHTWCNDQNISIKQRILENLRIELFKSYVKKYKFDIIHFHDLSRMNLLLVNECMNLGIRCMVTFHIFIGRDQISGYESLAKRESIFFSNVLNDKIALSTVSSGTAHRIAEKYSNVDLCNIKVIENGSDVGREHSSYLDGELQNTTIENTTIACIGTINNRKNQLKLVQAFINLPKDIKQNLQLLLIGNNKSEYAREVAKVASGDPNIKILGVLSTDDIKEAYKSIDVVVSVSLNESFGLTIIEAMNHGIPCIFSRSLDASEYFYDESACVLYENDTVDDISSAISTALSRHWDRSTIIKYSLKFSTSKMAEKYFNWYMNSAKFTD